MKGLFNWLRRFFFPPVGSPRWRRVLPYAILGLLTLLVLGASSYGWEYTNSSAFCGTACHTMPPEYVAYQISPHARVNCVECHLGRDTLTTIFGRKAGDARHIFFYLGKNYEVPIYATSMRPATDSCERCHWPEKFSNDKVRAIKRIAADEKNTATQIYLVMHTGGGAKRVGLGRGIHWHIETPVEYIATDELRQNIPYVRAVDANGKVTEYFDTESKLTPEQVKAEQQKGELRRVDCIDCHNRVTHDFRAPSKAIDQAMNFGQIDPSIPAIKAKALEIFDAQNKTIDEALKSFKALGDFYRIKYPDYAGRNQPKIDQAILQLETIYQETVFPDMKVNWDAHPDNLGHRDFPGCFRCHDGKHVSAEGTTIRLECNVCHSTPKIALAGQPEPLLMLGAPPEPDSHKDTNWLFLHRLELSEGCKACHDTKNAGLATNDSFCSNAACHGVDWKFAGLNAPGLRAKLAPILPKPAPAAPKAGGAATFASVIGPLFAAKCGACHGDTALVGLKLTDYAATMKGGQNGPVIVSGKSADSALVKKQSAGSHPGQLNANELAQVNAWIDAGAPEK